MKKTMTTIVTALVLLMITVTTAIGERYIVEMTLKELISCEASSEVVTMAEECLNDVNLDNIDLDNSYVRIIVDEKTGETKMEVNLKRNYGAIIANMWFTATDWCRDTAVTAGNAVVNTANSVVTTVSEGWNNFRGWIGF